MTRYYFDLDECGDLTVDEEGLLLRDLGAARARALVAAREIMASEIKEGRLCLGCALRIRVADRGEIFVLQFRDAVALSGEAPCTA